MPADLENSSDEATAEEIDRIARAMIEDRYPPGTVEDGCAAPAWDELVAPNAHPAEIEFLEAWRKKARQAVRWAVSGGFAARVRAEAVAAEREWIMGKLGMRRASRFSNLVNRKFREGWLLALDAVAADLAAGSVPVATPPRPEIVVLCGSTRFKDAFRDAAKAEALAGRIVLTVSDLDPRPEARHVNVPIDAETKARLGELHKRKIDLADRVLVLNVGGYVGESTRSEVEYATAHRKPITYLEPTCICPWTDPSAWTYYGGATEPGSEREFDPECPQHGQSAGPVATPTEPRGQADRMGGFIYDPDDEGPECGWLKEPDDTRYGCQLPGGHSGKCEPASPVPAEQPQPRGVGGHAPGCEGWRPPTALGHGRSVPHRCEPGCPRAEQPGER